MQSDAEQWSRERLGSPMRKIGIKGSALNADISDLGVCAILVGDQLKLARPVKDLSRIELLVEIMEIMREYRT